MYNLLRIQNNRSSPWIKISVTKQSPGTETYLLTRQNSKNHWWKLELQWLLRDAQTSPTPIELILLLRHNY